MHRLLATAAALTTGLALLVAPVALSADAPSERLRASVAKDPVSGKPIHCHGKKWC